MADEKRRDYSQIKDTLKVKGSFDLTHYADNVNYQLKYIQDKISEFEIKLTSLRTKESIISGIIDRTNANAAKFLDENNFAKAQGLQNALITQFETYSMMQDMILKYESHISNYVKLSLTIENDKVATYAKIKTADKNTDKDDDQYAKIVEQINTMMLDGKSGSAFTQNLKNELKLEGY